jgi:hypothetical protein
MKVIILIVCMILIQSCGFYIPMNGGNPSKKSFEYYQKGYTIDILTSTLKIERKYIRIDSFALNSDSLVDILVFFVDGFLNDHPTIGINGVSGRRSESGSIMGYYQLKKDSIFFTTKSYYQQFIATRYKGRISSNGDTLDLDVKYPHKPYKKETYILY